MRFGRCNGKHWMAAAGCVAVIWITQGLWAQQTKERVSVDDVDRDYIVRLPKGYDAQRHYPVLILLHGMNQDADDMQRLTRFDELADKDGIISIYPIALHGRWNVGVHAPRASGDDDGAGTAWTLWRRLPGRRIPGRGRWISSRRRTAATRPGAQ